VAAMHAHLVCLVQAPLVDLGHPQQQQQQQVLVALVVVVFPAARGQQLSRAGPSLSKAMCLCRCTTHACVVSTQTPPVLLPQQPLKWSPQQPPHQLQVC
jgi:hypothetical protein